MSCPHILGQCIYTKKARIQSHDTIKDYVLQQVLEKDKQAAVMKELILCSPEAEVPKPNLAVKNQDGVFMVDVIVCHEDGTTYDWRDVAR
jgi:hypothetical protein